jgi:UDP-glucose 4-epimerase
MKTPGARLPFTKKTVLVTGGAGYIGSHAVVKLLEAGADVLMLDNLCNSRADVIDRIAFITKKKPVFFIADIRDRLKLREILGSHQIDSVLHFAGLKAVGESEAEPLKYFDNNVGGTLVLLEEMAKAQVKTIVFSSSATVYGEPGVLRYTEDLPLKPVNVYGRTKLVVEDILRDLSRTDR